MVILAFYFDLVLPFYFLKWNRFFSTFIPVLSESRHYFNYLLSQEVCTNLQIKRFPLMKLWYTTWMYGGSESQNNNIKNHPSHIYSFLNYSSRNLLILTLIIIPLLWLLPKDLRKTLKTAYHYSLTNQTNYHYDNTKVNADISKMMGAEKFGKELYVVLLDDGKDFVCLVLKFMQLIFRQSSINE